MKIKKILKPPPSEGWNKNPLEKKTLFGDLDTRVGSSKNGPDTIIHMDQLPYHYG